VQDRTSPPGLTSLAAAVGTLAQTLATATCPDDIFNAALQGLRAALGVERAAVRLFDADGILRFKAWPGLSDDYQRAVEGYTPWVANQPSPVPIVTPDVHAAPALSPYRAAFDGEHIRALAFIPLVARGATIGALMLHWRAPYEPARETVDGALVIAALVSVAVERAHQHAAAIENAGRSALLAEASARLTGLDYEKNLDAIAQLLVPQFADWCVVDLLEGGELRRLAVAHVDRSKAELVRELGRRYPPRRDEPGGIWHVLSTGRARLFARIDDAMLRHTAIDADHLSLLRQVGVASAMLVPLSRGGDSFGVMSLVLNARDRTYDDRDLEFAQELARRVSYAIENARLYRQAQDASRAKDEFLAALSHELRTPLNAILGWASILRARPDGQIDRGLDVIYRNAKVQTQLVDDLLDASRIVSGRMSIDLKDVPLRPIVEAAVETILPQAVEKAIELTTSLPDSAIEIRGDAARLQQVLWNILNNAVKFTPRGGRIHVGTSVTPVEVAVHVADTGTGIRAEALPFIFDRFRQTDASSTRSYRGLGLGLTLARQLTEMHGGHIAASSPGPGQGSTFTVTLPLVEAAIPRPISAPHSATDALEGLRILAVDDDPDSLEVLISVLRLHHATVFGASSAFEALNVMQQERPDVIISDIAMPGHDGYWLMQQVSRVSREGGRDVPCVALTAFANDAARRRALATGFAAHLSKPFNPDELVNVIKPLVPSGRA
jgi:signal transduction histidine kinase/ActR/RegA family two-component response regulator